VTDRIGRKLLIGIAYVVVMIGITLEVIAHTQSDPNAAFFAGKFINGIAVGGLITTVMAYVGEVSWFSNFSISESRITLIRSWPLQRSVASQLPPVLWPSPWDHSPSPSY
jgi:MFS family permease